MGVFIVHVHCTVHSVKRNIQNIRSLLITQSWKLTPSLCILYDVYLWNSKCKASFLETFYIFDSYDSSSTWSTPFSKKKPGGWGVGGGGGVDLSIYKVILSLTLQS
jgi:hypothetical protein